MRPKLRRDRGSGRALAVLAGVTGILGWGLVPASAVASPPRALSVFSIAKSENKNQVVYSVSVDENCVPASSAPVFAYWRMLEKGPTATAPLLSREVSAYGVASQSVVERADGGGKVRVVLKALPGRPIVVETLRAADGACWALAKLPVAGAPAHLFNVYVHLTWLSDVDYLLLRAWTVDGEKVVTERVAK